MPAGKLQLCLGWNAWAPLLQTNCTRNARGYPAGTAFASSPAKGGQFACAKCLPLGLPMGMPLGRQLGLAPGLPLGRQLGRPFFIQENSLSNHVYKHIELTGSSTKSIEDAVSTAIAKASQSLRNIHWFQVVETRGHVENGKVAHWQVTIKVGFTLED